MVILLILGDLFKLLVKNKGDGDLILYYGVCGRWKDLRKWVAIVRGREDN
jgi:hypothetical protein